jgi:hypothetical protein
MKKIVALALASVALVFGLTACGGYDDSEYSTDDSGTSDSVFSY